MTARRTLTALCMLCALAFGALAAQGAAAATKGTTAFTCVNQGGSTHSFSDAHCKEKTGTGAFEHVAIAQDTTTELTGSNILTGVDRETHRFKTTVASMPVEIVAHKVSVSGWMENKKAASGEHYIVGEGALTYEEVTVDVPAGHGCMVQGGTITASKVKLTTEGQGDFVKFEPGPGTGGVFASLTLEGCVKPFESLNGTYTLTGSFKAVPNGATVKSTHAEVTAQNTLKLNGTIKTGVEGTWTFSARAAGSGGSFTPLSPTTVETP